MRYNLTDITFMIPVRIDSMIRFENLLLTIQSIQRNFITNIIVLEASDYNNGLVQKLLGNKIEYRFFEDRDPVFYRTKYINNMTEISDTPYLAIWDADVIIPKEQLIQSVDRLRDGVDVVFPYDGHFYDTSDTIRELYFKTKNIRVLKKNHNRMDLPYGAHMVGGAILVNKKSYVHSGKENLKFYGWGPEDGERFHRWKVLGMNVEFIPGYLFHLSHPRGTNSSFRSNNQRLHTQNELLLTQQSSKEELLSIINKQNVSK